MKPEVTYESKIENSSEPYYWPLHHVKNGLLHNLFLFFFPKQEQEPKMRLAPARVANKNNYTGR
jgi:hypothetical protein